MPKRSTFDWILEFLALAALAAVLVPVTAYWTELPARVPTHFGVSGSPDGWGDKNVLLLLPLIAVGLYILLTVVSRFPKLINVPVAIDRDAPEVRQLLQSMLITLKMVLLFVFAYLQWATINTALGNSSGIGTLFLPVSLVAIFLLLGFYLQKLRKPRV